MENNVLDQLVNAPFTLSFGGKEYTVRKASLEQAVLYQKRLKELATENDPSIDLKIIAYCLYLLLKESDPSVTEDFVLKNAPGNINPIEWLEKLGFMSPQRKSEMFRQK